MHHSTCAAISPRSARAPRMTDCAGLVPRYAFVFLVSQLHELHSSCLHSFTFSHACLLCKRLFNIKGNLNRTQYVFLPPGYTQNRLLFNNHPSIPHLSRPILGHGSLSSPIGRSRSTDTILPLLLYLNFPVLIFDKGYVWIRKYT